MITLFFTFGSEAVLVIIDGNDIKLGNTAQGAQMATIEGLKLDYSGVCREHPDLIDNDDWRSITIKRFKEKIESLKTENEKAEYLIDDLKKFGYTPKFKQRKGFRREKI